MTDPQAVFNEAAVSAKARLDEWLPQLDQFISFLDGLDSFWDRIDRLDASSLDTDPRIEEWRNQTSNDVTTLRDSAQSLKETLLSWKSEEEDAAKTEQERLDGAVKTFNAFKEEFESFVATASGVEAALELCVTAGYKAIAPNRGKGWIDIWGMHAERAEDISGRLGGQNPTEDRDILGLKHSSGLSIAAIKLALNIKMPEPTLAARISRIQDRVTHGLILELSEENGAVDGFKIIKPNVNPRYGNGYANLSQHITLRSPDGRVVRIDGLEEKTNRIGGVTPACVRAQLDVIGRLDRAEQNGEDPEIARILAILDIKHGILRFYNSETRQFLLKDRDEDFEFDGVTGAETSRENGFTSPAHLPSTDPDGLDSDFYPPGKEPKLTLLEAVGDVGL